MERRRKARIAGLPEEVIVDILTRLPAKSVGQFRCVSKQWCSLLSDPQFIKAHLNFHAHKAERKLIFISRSRYLHTITFNPQNGNDGISRNLHFQKLSNKYRIVGSCNGLVLVVDRKSFKLINPNLRIPIFELDIAPDRYVTYGLGYDSATDDYKVVALSHSNRLSNKSTLFDVFSVKRGFWRRLESSGFDEAHPIGAPGLLLNGALHWLVIKTNISKWVIVAFDLSGETFLELGTPEFYWGVALYELVVLRGCLCMVTHSEENKLGVWMMKYYGVEESWTKFSFTRPNSRSIGPFPMCLTSDDDLVLDLVVGGKLIVYNMKEDQWWDVMVDEITLSYKSAGIFKESLVSPTFDEGNDGYFNA